MRFWTNYSPYMITDYMNSVIVQGIVARIQYRRYFRFFPLVYQNKDVYYWLPYKKVVQASAKFSVIGSKGRDPYSACWFEIKKDSEIYKQGLNVFVNQQKKLYKAKNKLRVGITFTPDELIVTTKKSIIRYLDGRFMPKTNKQRNGE